MHVYDFDNITKSTALGYANELCSRMSSILDEEEIPDILWGPFELQDFDQDEIRNRLNLLTPERCITMFVSKLVEKEQDLSREHWYDTPFKRIKL